MNKKYTNNNKTSYVIITLILFLKFNVHVVYIFYHINVYLGTLNMWLMIKIDLKNSKI